MSNKRIYVIHHNHSKTSRLVRAQSAARALKHVVNGDYKVSVAEQDDLVKLVAEGVKVEDVAGE